MSASAVITHIVSAKVESTNPALYFWKSDTDFSPGSADVAMTQRNTTWGSWTAS